MILTVDTAKKEVFFKGGTEQQAKSTLDEFISDFWDFREEYEDTFDWYFDYENINATI